MAARAGDTASHLTGAHLRPDQRKRTEEPGNTGLIRAALTGVAHAAGRHFFGVVVERFDDIREFVRGVLDGGAMWCWSS